MCGEGVVHYASTVTILLNLSDILDGQYGTSAMCAQYCFVFS